MTLTTDDCKRFLQAQGPQSGLPQNAQWKRVSKFKGEGGWVRVFESSCGARASLVEDDAGALRLLPQDKTATGPERAAQLWIDAMRVLGGHKALRSRGPKPGASWSQFIEGLQDGRSGLEKTALYDWLEEAMKDPEAAKMVASRCGWCFSDDADSQEADGHFRQGSGALVAVFFLDCPDEELGWLPSPMAFLNFSNSMEGIWHAGQAGVGGAGSMAQAWQEMKALGFVFSHQKQEEWGQDGEYDPKFPLHEKVWSVIPELAAEREARALAQAAAPAASSRGPAL